MKLHDLRIRNYRSIESLDITLGDTAILFGKNDSGKSNIVKALEFAFDRSRQMDVSNVHVSPKHPDPKETTVVVDIRFTGDMANDIQWALAFGENIVDIGNDGRLSLSFRVEAAYSPETRSFEKTRHIITNWEDGTVDNSHLLPIGLFDSIDFVLLDAHRDLAEVIRDRYSRWSQEVRKADISEDEAAEIEKELARIGTSIVKASPFLAAAENELKGATDHRASRVEIAPVARSLNELYRSLDVLVSENAGPSISISLFGSGTRSRAEFMAFKALISIAKQSARNKGLPYYCLAVFEEPEAHIHPQSQQQLLVELEKLGSQRVITTHSPFLLSKAPMSSLIHVQHIDHNAVLTPMDVNLTQEQRKDTERYLLRTHGELLFADTVIFAEGETEEQALPVYFKRRYKRLPFELGVTIVSCGGDNYEPFIRIVNKLGIEWYILSDAEPNVLEAVRRQISNALDEDVDDLGTLTQVVTCRKDNDYEADLIADGYGPQMLKAIRAYDDSHRTTGKKQKLVFNSWLRKTNHQHKKGGGTHDFDGPEGELRALEEYMDKPENKARYALPIAEEIVKTADEKRCIPSAVSKLFSKLDDVLPAAEDESDD